MKTYAKLAGILLGAASTAVLVMVHLCRRAIEEGFSGVIQGQSEAALLAAQNQISARIGWILAVTAALALAAVLAAFRKVLRPLLDEERQRASHIFRQVLDAIHDLVFVKEPESKIVWANEAFKNYYRMSNDELLNRVEVMGTSPEIVQQYMKDDAHVFNTGKTLNIPEEPIVRYDGESRLFHTVKSPIFGPDGKVAMMVGVSRDMTEKKTAEERLRVSTAQLEAIFANLQEAILVVEPATRLIKNCNIAVSGVFGYSREELVGQDTRKLHIDEEAFLLLGQKMTQALAARRPLQLEYKMRRRNGEIFPVEISFAPVFKADGAADLIVGAVRDLSEKRRDENIRARLSQVVEQAEESVVITNLAGTIEYVNPAFEKVSGYTKEELIGQNPRIVKSGKHKAPFYDHLWDTLLKGKTWRGRFFNKRKDGTIFEEESIIFPVRDVMGHTQNFVAIKRDMTKQVDLETQLLQAQKMEAVGRLAGGVAHDFNNMLTTILGFSEIILGETDPKSPLAEEVTEIMKAGKRAAALTQQLLAFSRKQVRSPRPLDPNLVLADLDKILRHAIGEDIRLRVVPAAEPWKIQADPNQMSQVLMNLVVNSRDAMPNGGTLEIRIENLTIDDMSVYKDEKVKPGQYICIAVADTGSGMSEETQNHIFEPFFTTKPKGKGTGLGLATVYGIVKQNGGYLAVDSKEGEGTTFRVYLPRSLDAAASDAEAEASLETRGTETVLIVEDEEMVRTMAHRSLATRGYNVFPCDSGQKALEILAKTAAPIHLLLTDVIMPEMNGAALAEKVRASWPATKILFMSGYTDEMIAAHGVLEPGIHFLPKPFTPKDLARKVREVLGPPVS